MIQPTLFCGSYHYEADPTNGDHLPADGAFYGYPFFNSSGYHQEGLLQALIPSSCREDEPEFACYPWIKALESEEVYEGEQQPYNSSRNWLCRYNSIFNGCWEDNYGSFSNEINNNKNNNEMEKTEHSNQSDREWCGSRYTCQDEDEDYYYPWSCCDTWLDYGGERDSSHYGGEETTDLTYSRCLPDIGVYEGLFGYWPCLYRRN